MNKFCTILAAILAALLSGCTWNTDLNDSGTKRVQTFTSLFAPNLSIYQDDEVQMTVCPPPPGVCTVQGYSSVYAGAPTVGQLSNAVGLIVGATVLRPSTNVSNNQGGAGNGYGGNATSGANSAADAASHSQSTFNLNGVPQ